MSESNTMFNDRDRRCTDVRLIHSTDPSYDNRTIASTLKMHIWIARNNRGVPTVMKTKFPATVIVFGVVSIEGHSMSPHIFEVGFYTNPKSDRSLLSCLKVTQCSTSEIGDAPLYNSCSLPIQVMKTRRLSAPSKCKSGRFNKVSGYGYGLWCGFK